MRRLVFGLLALSLSVTGDLLALQPERTIVGFYETSFLDELGDHDELLRVDHGLSFAVLLLSPGTESKLIGDSRVRYVARDELVPVLAWPSSDPLAGEQWGVGAADFPAAWAHGTTGVPIGYVDSGANAEHEDLRDLRVASVVDAPAGDGCGHGTAIGGVLRADVDNGIGVAGLVASNVTSYKAFVATAQGCRGFWSDIATATHEAVAAGARVLSLSLGSGSSNPAMVDALDQAARKRVFVAAAAGNHGPCVDCLLFPASHASVTAVGCVQQDGRMCPFTATGPNLRLLAPGVNITTTTTAGSYASFSGTSLSVPFVAAGAALLLEENPFLSPAAVRDALWLTAEPTDAGFRAVKAGRAISARPENAAVSGLDVVSDPFGKLRVRVGVECQSVQIMSDAWAVVQVLTEDGRAVYEETLALPPGSSGMEKSVATTFTVLPVGTYEVRVHIQRENGLDVSDEDDSHATRIIFPILDPLGGQSQGRGPLTKAMAPKEAKETEGAS